ncbi:MAG: hypothetical protein GC204_14845 [Chloroflexi bacterium]|nr:hypothetical protein [Chloroflexota bacterium]
MKNKASFLFCTCALVIFAACASSSAEQTFSATLPALTITAPLYTDTPVFTPSQTFTASPTLTTTAALAPTDTLAASVTSVASATETSAIETTAAVVSVAQAATVIASEVPSSTVPPDVASATPLPTMTLTPSIVPTQPLYTLTPVSNAGAPAKNASSDSDAALSANSGWSCDDFPCGDDIPGFLQRIQVPAGFHVEHVGRFPGQPMQITYGPDGLLYATVLENGTRSGAVYVMDADGNSARYSSDLVSPLGLAFQPGTDVLFVSARVTLDKDGGIWRIPAGGGKPESVISDLPCCYNAINNQPNGMSFGQDGYLYLGVGSLTDTTANPPRSAKSWADLAPYEASILRINPLTGETSVYAQGTRDPFDVAADSSGQLYATDDGLVTGQGDRLLQINAGAHYGWPYWGGRGCENCPLKPASIKVSPDLIAFPPYTRPRGLVAYTGTQFPAEMFDTLFVTLWNGVEGGQRVIRVDPRRMNEDNYVPQAFVTGLIRPIDVAVAPDGSLVVADYVYGNIWRVVYDG